MWEAVRAPTTTTAADVLSSRSLVITERNRGVVPRGSYTVMDAGCASVAAHFVSPRLVACLPSHLMQHTACSMAGIYPCRRLGEGGMHRPAQLPAIYYPAPTRRAALLLTMSSDDTAGFLSDLTAAYHDNLSIVSITALLLYDWATTLPTEQDVVWSRKMNVASVLYILARVCGPLYYLSTIVLLGYVDDTVCKALVYVQDISALLPYAVWAVFSTYRGYALSGRTRYVAAIIFTLTLVPIGVNMCPTARAAA
ncbi:hypothetical protein C2E23DRAFT_431869 [Lenzites betulinus]|nr:hypothetical protein C2E23DRAFT_431869 [Lenzites betulinus]